MRRIKTVVVRRSLVGWKVLENLCRPSGTRSGIRLHPGLTSLCENLHPGISPWAVFWRRFAAGNYDSLATCGSEFKFSHRLLHPGLTCFAPAGLVFAGFHSTSSAPARFQRGVRNLK